MNRKVLNFSMAFLVLCMAACGAKNSTEKNGRQQANQKNGPNEKGNPRAPSVPSVPDPKDQKIDENNPAGFYSILAKGVPAPVQGAAKSVFHLKILGGRSMKTIDVSHGEADKKKEEAKGYVQKNGLDEMTLTVLEKQIEACTKLDTVAKQKDCKISYDVFLSTGVLLADGQTLFTNATAFKGSIDYITQKTGTAQADFLKAKTPQVYIFVFDSEGKLVVNPLEEKVLLKALPEETKAAKARKEFFAADSDYVTISLPKSLGSGLTLSSSKAAVSERIYVLGYPLCTGCSANVESAQDQSAKDQSADRTPSINSDGKGLKVTTGLIVHLSAEDLATRMEVKEPQSLDLNKMGFYTADAQLGMAGGPVLNAKGEVLGLHVTSRNYKEGDKIKRVSRMVIPTLQK